MCPHILHVCHLILHVTYFANSSSSPTLSLHHLLLSLPSTTPSLLPYLLPPPFHIRVYSFNLSLKSRPCICYHHCKSKSHLQPHYTSQDPNLILHSLSHLKQPTMISAIDIKFRQLQATNFITIKIEDKKIRSEDVAV